ncbi:hypothetical protein NPIL_564591 [Nephila pilipes]|uniref:Uncharacterized protein n=1 Tax=Nephila pilipes TaxID=299642 RepID=A0A8X6U134_NEPPI|nr:hypothetical protein NPIL_564591 [Nephila pilipes]
MDVERQWRVLGLLCYRSINEPSFNRHLSSSTRSSRSCATRANTFLSRYINQLSSCVDRPFRHGPGEGRTLNVTPGAVSQGSALFANEQREN